MFAAMAFEVSSSITTTVFNPTHNKSARFVLFSFKKQLQLIIRLAKVTPRKSLIPFSYSTIGFEGFCLNKKLRN